MNKSEIFLKSNVHASSGTTQPILCCVGQSAAGSPTQFMMERAIAATETDWRAITAEVNAGDLGRALAGMLAMKFMAVRFFQTLQASALEHLGSDDRRLCFIGGVTSAVRTQDGWRAWHNWGPAILNWTREQVELPHTLCWLHGDSDRVRSLLVAMHDAPQVRHGLPGVILWTNPPEAVPEQLTSIPRPENSLMVHLIQDHEPLMQNAMQRLKTLAVECNSRNLLFVGDEFPDLGRELLEELNATIDGCLLITRDTASRQGVERQLPKLARLKEAEQIVACEVYDFYQWTGQRVSSALLHDAYDEYCDF